ncbi:hypothetical protein GCM10023185_28870 [Hymenobacter saemangeumensis]|uniref:T9SS type A sorting domain-containing protein n=1 Tax=Hymenobacter saemangeumensis TaxID=1084522 RepID=A0ABP8IKU3_9BACT
MLPLLWLLATPAARAQYCVTNLGGGSCDITQVQVVGTTLSTTASLCPNTSANNYSSYPASGTTTATLQRGTVYTISVTTTTADIISMWGDWNRNGTFEASEWTQVAVASTAGMPATASFTVPAGASAGSTGLRIRTRFSGNANAASDACSNFGSGETRDYVVTIAGTSGAPANDNCSGATVLAVSTSCTPTTGTTVNATSSTVGPTSCGGSSNGNDVWYRLTVPAGMTQITVETSASTGSPLNDTVLEIYRGSCSSLTSIGCNDDANGGFSQLVLAVTPGETLFARVLPYTSGPNGAFQICAYGTQTTTNTTTPAPYCAAASSVGCGNGTITNVSLAGTGLNNSSGCSVNASNHPYYNYPAAGSATGTVQAGSSYPLSVVSDAGQIVSVWVDWNRNAVFDASEWLQVTTSSTGSGESVTLAVPASTTAGTVRMRVRSRAAGSPNGSTDACSTFGSGEAEDYTLTVINPGNTTNPAPYCVAPSNVGCGNGNITNVTLTGTTLNNSSGCSLNASGYPYYNYPATGNATGTVQAGSSYSLSVTSELNNIVSVWVDWNQNGTLEASEWLQVTTSSTDGVPATIALPVPVSALAGPTRMRIRTRAAGSTNGAVDACTSFASGETEDYTITVANCAAPAAPAVTGASRCGAGSVTLSASGAPAGGSYRWYAAASGGTSLNSTASYTTPALSATTTYYVSIVNSTGCESARTMVTATINALPVANAGPARSICSGASATLGSAPAAGVTYSWSPATGLSSASAAQPTVTLANTTGTATTTTYTLTATSAQGCTATSTVAVTVNPAAVADAGPARSVCSGVGTQLGTPAVAGTTYRWSPATGLSSTTAAQPTATLTNTTGAATTATYTVTATTAQGCTATSTVTLTVNPAAVANAGPARSFCSGQSAQLGSAPTAGTTYSWSPATGLSSAGIAQPTVTLTNTTSVPTTTTYTVTATTASGCTATSTVAVTVNPATSASFSYAAPSYCLNATTAPVPTVTGTAGGTFTATPAGLSLNATTGAVNLSASSAGSYLVTYSVAGSCPSNSTVALALEPIPTASITASGATSFCQGGSVTLTASGGGIYAWSNGQTTPSITVSSAGNYTVTVTSASGCSATSAATTVTVNPTPATPTITRAGNTLTSSSTTGNQWYLDGNLIPGATGASYVISGPGAYTVVVTASGCPSGPSTPVLITGNARALPGSSLQVYPNPTPNGRFTVELQGYTQPVELTLLNALGQVVFTRSLPASAQGQAALRLELDNLAAGVYVLQAATKGGLDTRRIAVSR